MKKINMKRVTDCVKNNYAVVQFLESSSNDDPLIEVIHNNWLTDNNTAVWCPGTKNWKKKLKLKGFPKTDWIKHACRILKSGFGN